MIYFNSLFVYLPFQGPAQESFTYMETLQFSHLLLFRWVLCSPNAALGSVNFCSSGTDDTV
jgi:hypothetical protein